MILLREKQELTPREMATKCQVSIRLLYILEEGDGITHPRIATAMALAYGMNVSQRNELCADMHKIDALPKSVQRGKKSFSANESEPFIPVNAECIRVLMERQTANGVGSAKRFALDSAWLREAMDKGMIRTSDLRRLAKILGVKPDQLKASKPD